MRRAVVLLLALGIGPAAAAAETSDPPIVVELFTSEGCSSCPPADAFLTDLAQQRRDVLPLAFHVTYWNGLGWKDPFSFEGATARQHRYASVLEDGQVYTPEMVVNGARSFVGSDRADGLAELSRAARAPGTHVPLRLTRNGDRLVISIGPGTDQAAIVLVGYDPEHRTPIGRGENGGRTLLESNIVRSLATVGRWTGSETELREALPEGERFAVLLQRDDGRILSAAMLEASGF